jgi:hypothetical protein
MSMQTQGVGVCCACMHARTRGMRPYSCALKYACVCCVLVFVQRSGGKRSRCVCAAAFVPAGIQVRYLSGLGFRA